MLKLRLNVPASVVAEIKECCRKAHQLGISLVQASRYSVPMARSAAEQIKALRQMVSGKFISASMPGVYRYEEETAAAGRHVIGSRAIR